MITDEQAKHWAEYFIGAHNNFYEFSGIYEDEDFTEDFPDEGDWRKVHDFMVSAKVEVSWNG